MQSRNKTLLLIGAFVLATLVASSAFASIEVVVDGVGADRESAINDAQRNAVATAVGQVVDSRTLVANFQLVSDKILTSASGYVRTYQVISEGAAPTGYRVQIRAIVEQQSIRNDVDAIAVLKAKRGDPRFVVVPDPQGAGDREIADQAERGIESYLAERQLQVIQAPAYNVQTGMTSPAALRDLSLWGAGLGAEYVIYYTAGVEPDESGRTFKQAEGDVDLAIIHTGSYRIIAQVSGSATVGDKKAKKAMEKAARAAGEKAAGKGIDLVLADWSRAGNTAGAQIMLTIEDIDGNDLQKLESLMLEDGTVNQLNRRSLEDGTATIQVTIDGGPWELGEVIGRLLDQLNWEWALVGSDSQSLTYRVPQRYAPGPELEMHEEGMVKEPIEE